MIASVAHQPDLPSLNLSPVRGILQGHQFLVPPPKLLTSKYQESLFSHKKLNQHLTNTHSPVVTSSKELPPIKSEVIGFYVNWDDNSFTSLKQNISRLDKLMPEWLDLTQSDGAIAVDDIGKQNRALDYIHQHRPELAIMPLINNFDNKTQSWNQASLVQLLNDSTARKRVIQNLLEFVRSNHFAGINY